MVKETAYKDSNPHNRHFAGKTGRRCVSRGSSAWHARLQSRLNLHAGEFRLNAARWLLLVLGPLPIVVGTMAVSRWCKPPSALAGQRNVVAAVRNGYAADTSPVRPAEAGAAGLAQACELAATKWRERLPAGCNVLAAPPLVLAGDLSTDELQRWQGETIEPAMRGMAACYLDTLPHLPVTVLLWADESSYDRATRELFSEQQVSVFGYYRPTERVLVMNIGTGSGTLVHELTHALLAFDFPTVPDWFNEGLASLHEQCRIRSDGSGLDGLVNWRLASLQFAIEHKTLRPLAEMMADENFRRLEAVNYAQARYFCMFLQQRGLLAAYYRQFRDDWRRDPQGAATALALFPGQTWPQVDEQFRAWAADLRVQ